MANVIKLKNSGTANTSPTSLEYGEIAINYKNWVDWVEQTGGDDPQKAVDLVLKLISTVSDDVNGEFCWIDNPLQAPTKSW